MMQSIMGDSKAVLPKLSHNWEDAKKFNAQRIRRQGRFNSKKNNEKENLNSAFHEQNGSGSTVTQPALAVSVTMSEDEDSQGQIVHESSFSDNETTNISAWAMMEHYEFSRDCTSKRSDNSNRESETQSLQIFDIQEDTRVQNPVVAQEQLLMPTKIEWQENDKGELIEPSIYDDSSCTQGVVISQTHSSSSPSHQTVPIDGISWSSSCIGEEEEGSVYTAKFDTFQKAAARVRTQWDQHRGMSTTAVLQDDCIPRGNVHEENVNGCDESTFSINDGKVSALSNQSSLAGAGDEASMHTNIESNKTFYVSKIEELESDLRNQKISTAEVQSKLKDRVVELEQALRVTAATPKGTVVQENPLKTLLDRNQTLVKEVRFADQTCVELSSRIATLEQENKTLLERVEDLEQENSSLRRGKDCGANTSKQDAKAINLSGRDKKQSNFGAKSDSSMSIPTDSLSAEVHRTREESKCLEQQLLNMKNLLETKNREFEEEVKIRVITNKEVAEENKFRVSESAAERMSDDIHKLHFLSLEEQLQRERAMVASLKKEFDTLRTMQQHSTFPPDEQLNFESMKMVSNVLGDMHHRYKSLEDRVVTTFDIYISKLEDLCKKVELLKSSLLFEAEPEIPDVKSWRGNERAGESFVSTPSTKEDDVLALMEEARIPADSHIEFHDDDSSINFEDISHFVIDDDTLGSITKNRSMVTEEELIRWKENLEAVLSECNRVKKRSTELRDELTRQKSMIESLEAENGKLSLQNSRKAEEIRMVDKALLEAREVIVELELQLVAANKKNDDELKASREKDENIATLQKSMQRAESDCTMANTKQEILEQRVSELELCLSEKAKMLEEAAQLSSTYRVKNDELSKELLRSEEAVRVKVENAVSDLQLSLEQANECIEDLKIKRQEKIDELSHAVELNTSQKKQIEELENQKSKNASDIEDSILESQCSLEAMRRERAALRSKLSKREAELSGLKEIHTTYKETNQIQLDKRLKQIQSFRAEREDTIFQCENLRKVREDFLVLIQSFDLCDNFVHDIPAKWSVGYQNGKLQCLEQEISCWRDILQYIGGVLHTIPRRNKDLSEAVERNGVLCNDLVTLKKSEKELKKVLEQERNQNEKLCGLLGQAEFEMERSALQIQEMSAALSHLQTKEADLNEMVGSKEAENSRYSEQLIMLQNQVSNERKEMDQEKTEMGHKLKEQAFQLVKATAELTAAKGELEKMMDHQESQATMLASREGKLMASESKCSRLRDYIQKLTKKCEEWEKSYDQQLQCIEKLRRKNVKVLDKASEIAKKYHKLKEDFRKKQRCNSGDRKKWNHERSNIQAVHMQLEEELDLIAKEFNAS